MQVFHSEHEDRAYSVETFLLSYTLLEIPFEIISSLIFGVLATMAVGLQRTPQMLFLESLNCFCLLNCGESLGIMFNTFFDHSGFALSATSVILSVAMMMAGVLSTNLPAFLEAFNHLSPAKWSLGNLAVYTLREEVFTCTESQRLADGECPIATGKQVLDLYNLDVHPGLYLMALGMCCIVYRLMAYLLLKLKMSSITKSTLRSSITSRTRKT